MTVDGARGRARKEVIADFRVVTARLLQDHGYSQCRARSYQATDSQHPPVLLINSMMADTYSRERTRWGAGSRYAAMTGRALVQRSPAWSADTRHTSLDGAVRPQLYSTRTSAVAQMRCCCGRETIRWLRVGRPRRCSRTRHQPACRPDSHDDGSVSDAVARQRFTMFSRRPVCCPGVVLSLVGLSPSSRSRSPSEPHELGLRVALGATPRNLLGLVPLTAAARGVGVALGLTTAFVLARFLREPAVRRHRPRSRTFIVSLSC